MGDDDSADSTRTCGSCHFWRLDKLSGNGIGWGQCRRMPPALPAVRDDKLILVGAWPHTEERDWCGEWRERHAAAPA